MKTELVRDLSSIHGIRQVLWHIHKELKSVREQEKERTRKINLEVKTTAQIEKKNYVDAKMSLLATSVCHSQQVWITFAGFGCGQ